MADLDAVLTSAEAAELLEITPHRLRQLIGDGSVDKAGRNGVTLRAAVQGYLRFLRDDTRRSSKSAAASRLQEAKVREIDLRIAEREGSLIDLREHQDIVAEVVGTIRSGLSGVPAILSDDIDERRRIEAAIDDVLRRAADRLDKASAELALGGAPAEADAGDDA